VEALWLYFCGAFFSSFFSALILIPVMMRLAHRLQFLDTPDGAIKKHISQVPYLGGLAVYLSFFLPVFLLISHTSFFLSFFASSTLLLFIGLYDDYFVLRPYQKFLGQLAPVILLLSFGARLHPLFFSHPIIILCAAFWMLSIINAFNLVDIMDGLATILAFIAAGAFFTISLVLGDSYLSIILLSFMGSLCAFFLYNKPPARIYLGDAGSLFIGGVIAAIPFFISWSSMHLEGFVAPFLILAVPFMIIAVPSIEIFSLVVLRTWNRIPFYRASSHHFVHYLRRKQWSVHQILFFVACVSEPWTPTFTQVC